MIEVACTLAPGQGFQKRSESIRNHAKVLGDGYVQVSSPKIDWFIYCRNGEIVYLSNSIEPHERLSRVLRGCLQGTTVDSQGLLLQVQEKFEQLSSSPDSSKAKADYQVLAWLARTGQLTPQLMSQLIYKLNLEIMEVFTLLPSQDYLLESIAIPGLEFLPACDFQALHQEAVARLEQWQTLQPELFSPYQRPYLTGMPLTDLAPGLQSKLRQVLIGFSWRQIAMLMNQDELALAQQFLPLFRKGVIKLHDPFAPFDLLPWKRQNISKSSSQHVRAASPAAAVASELMTRKAGATSSTTARGASQVVTSPSAATSSTELRAQWPTEGRSQVQASPSIVGTGATASGKSQVKTWKIVCIDDSPAVLNEINRLLKKDIFSVTLIDDSKKALMKINSIQPDVILLDANMPGVDGYQVCMMLRKSNKLKDIPVIMVTGNRGLINRARAKMAGVTDYLNKPFSEKDLLTMVFRYLSR